MKKTILAVSLLFGAANSVAGKLPLYDHEPYCFSGKLYSISFAPNEVVVSLMLVKDKDGFIYDCTVNKHGGMNIERSMTTYEAPGLLFQR